MSSSLLAPAYSLNVGSQGWTEQLTKVDVHLLAAPLLDHLAASMPAAAPVTAAPGDPVSLSLDGGEGSHEVFTGLVSSVRRDGRTTTITAVDAGGALADLRPAATFEQATVGTVISELCADAGVDTGSIEVGPALPFYVADPGRTALEHVARLAAWAGALAAVDSKGRLEVNVVAGADADVALRYGREVLLLEWTEAAAPVETFVVAGEGTQAESLRPTRDFFAGRRPDGPSKTTVWAWEPALRTPAAANTASSSLTRLYRSGRSRALLEAWMQPQLRPGTVLEIQEVPEGLHGGPFWIDRVSHSVSAQGAFTRARLWSGGEAFSPAGLLGPLAGAVKGLV